MRVIPTTAATAASAADTAARHSHTPAQAPLHRPGDAIMSDPTTAAILYAAWAGDPAICSPAPPGSGKTRLVALLAATLSTRADLRVGIAAQTRDQAIEIARRLDALDCPARLIWPQKEPAPPLGPGPARTVAGRQARYPSSGGGIVIATTARWTFADPRTLACDLMIVDEAWQATFADLGALGAFAAQIVCVGDPGQIDPVVTGATTRWTDSPTGPHLPAPTALLAAHRHAVTVVTLPHTWRLGPTTTALIQPAFYPDLPFTSRRPPTHMTDRNGHRLPEVSAHPLTLTAGPGDPTLTGTCADLARDLLTTTLTTPDGTRALTPADVAVVAAHVHQAAALRALLADLPDVLVGTANQLQGMERAAVIVAHPLAGHRDANTFGTDLGRACVMLTRHRAHLALVTDHATPAVLDTAEDRTPAITTHRRLLDTLLAAT